MHTALVCHAQSRLVEAEGLYRQILSHDPDHAAALGMLAIILADGQDADAAEAIILRHLALRPKDGASLHRLGRLRAQQGLDAEAVDILARAARALPGLAPIYNDLGVSLHRLDRQQEALEALDRAVDLAPLYAVAQCNRGAVLFDLQRFDEATDGQLAALAQVDASAAEDRAAILYSLSKAAKKAGRLPVAEAALRAELDAGRYDSDTVTQLSEILDHAGRADEALALRNDLSRRTGLRRTGNTEAAVTLLVVAGAAGGLIPTRYLLDPQTFSILSLTLLTADQADAPLGAVDMKSIQDADAVFSILADVDHDRGQFDLAASLCQALGKSVINPPQAIRKTGRDQAAALFAGIPAMVTPVVRYTDAETLAAMSVESPILVRPVGDHGGDNLVLLRTPANRDRFLTERPDRPLLFSPFHDFQSPDGHWRKYRFIFVDRRVHPYHLAIGDNWLVHYWRADMQRSPWKLAEEERFLHDWQAVFGPRAVQAVEEAGRRLDLDYGGMDCALTPDGEVLLFEANASMLLHLDEPSAVFAYKRRHVRLIREAFTQMVLERAGRLAG